MIYKERLFKIIQFPHISEKTSVKLDKFNTVVVKVSRYATKTDIKHAVYILFSIKLKKINVLITSKKKRGSKQNKKVGYRCDWKKAYLILEDGYHLDLINEIKYK